MTWLSLEFTSVILFHSETASLWEENFKKNIWAHKRKSNLENQNQWKTRQTDKTQKYS